MHEGLLLIESFLILLLLLLLLVMLLLPLMKVILLCALPFQFLNFALMHLAIRNAFSHLCLLPPSQVQLLTSTSCRFLLQLLLSYVLIPA